MGKVVIALALCVSLTACRSLSFHFDSESSPASTPFAVTARFAALGRGYYSAFVDLRNSSSTELGLSHDMFSVEAPDPVYFVAASRISWGRPGFRIPRTVPAGGHVSGDVIFGIRGGEVPASPVTLRISLPDGEHRFVFNVQR